MPSAADLFRAGYAQPTEVLSQQPITRLVLAEMKAQLDARQSHADHARSLHAFFSKHDKGYGAVR